METQVLSLLLPICLPYIPLVGKDDGYRVRQQQKQKKRDQTRGAVEARHSAQVRTGISPGKVVGLGVRYPQAGYETLSSHYPLTPNCRMEIIRGSCLFWVPNPPGVLRQSENPSILPSHFPLKLRLPIGPKFPTDSQVQVLYSPHSGGSSRSVATWRTVPFRFRHGEAASSTNHFHATALGAAIFGESE